MRKLAPTSRDAEMDFHTIASKRRPDSTRSLVLGSAPTVYDAYIRYKGFYSFSNISIDRSVATSNPLASALRGNFSALKKGARYESMRDDVLSTVDGDNQLCPYCLVQYVGRAIDHVL